MKIFDKVGYISVVGDIIQVLEYLGLRFKKRLYLGQKFNLNGKTYYLNAIYRMGEILHCELSENEENDLVVNSIENDEISEIKVNKSEVMENI